MAAPAHYLADDARRKAVEESKKMFDKLEARIKVLEEEIIELKNKA